MEIIHLRQTLPQVFADRDAITSDVWHQDLVLQKGERYLIEAASAQVNPLYAAISTDIAATIRVSLTSMNEISVHSPSMNGWNYESIH